MKPPTRVEPLVESLHGVPVSDPYRWLEDEASPEVTAWTAAQNAHTADVLGRFPGRDRLRARIEAYLSIGTISAPALRRGRLFYLRREGRVNQPILYVRDGVDGAERVLLDPNPLSADGTVALDWSYASNDGRRLAYGVSAGGSELSTLRVRDVDAGRDLPDQIPHTRACSLAWDADGEGFHYTRYPAPGSVPDGQEWYHRRVHHHRLGDDPAADPLVWGEGRDPDAWPNVAVSPDGRWLVVEEYKGWTRAELFVRDLRGPGGFAPMVTGRDAIYGTLPLNDRILVLTNEGASTYRLFCADPARPGRDAWAEIIPPGEDVLQGLIVVGGRIVAEYLHHAASRLRLFALDGSPEGEIALPTLGSLAGFRGEWDGDEMYFAFTSFTFPPAVYRWDPRSGRTSLWTQVASPVDPDDYVIEQVRFASRDGTSIPMFVVHRKGVRRDGSNRILLTGYGGFNVSSTPAFDRTSFVWLERGGIVAQANLRGGGEYGEAWHRAGMLANKQNVFDDFIAAAEHLIREGWTEPGRLAIEGGSNGGLLVGAAITQRPDLFRAAVCAVPLLDMLRYHNFQIARLWIPEYGSAEEPEPFRWLLDYSPYHRVKDGVAYPAVLFTTAESDSRVDPMHARKMAARLQAAQGAKERPILLRVEMRAGHGQGKPLSKKIEETTDVLTFLFQQLGMEI